MRTTKRWDHVTTTCTATHDPLLTRTTFSLFLFFYNSEWIS